MDVNPNRAPWVWVRSDDLIAAMRTFDTVENRGYLLVSEVEQKTTDMFGGRHRPANERCEEVTADSGRG